VKWIETVNEIATGTGIEETAEMIGSRIPIDLARLGPGHAHLEVTATAPDVLRHVVV
jgi:hypothetical protein